MFPWQGYNPAYFIERPAALKEIQDWANASDITKRVLSLVGPPGGGKTWLLKKLHGEWKNSGDRFAVWMDIPTLVNRSEKQDQNRMINATAFGTWFDEVQQTAQRYCPYIKSISTIVDFSAMVSALVRLVCDCNLDYAPLVIVDGYDEITKEQAEVISRRILERFIEQRCIRMLIAHRAEWKIEGDSIRRNQRKLFLHQEDPLSRDFARKQYKALFIDKFPKQPIFNPNNWMNQLQHYQWDHTLINAFLFLRGLDQGPRPLRKLIDDDFIDCCQTVIQRPDSAGNPRYPALANNEFNVLHSIATQLDPEWTQNEVEKLLSILFFQDKTIGKLYDLGLICESSPNINHYEIAAGLRELLCEF